MMADANHIKIWLAGKEAPFLSVVRFMVREDIGGLWSIHADVTADDATFPLDEFVDRGAAFALERPNRPTVPVRIWSGICTAITHAGASQKSTYSIRIAPELYRLTLGRSSRVFQHKSVPAIVMKILAEWKIDVFTRNLDIADEKRFPKLEMRVQYEESDFSFIARLLEEAGITFYFDYANDYALAKEGARDLTKLVLDGEPQLATPEQVRELAYRGHHDNDALFGISEDFAANAGVTRMLAPGAVTFIDHDFRLATVARPFQQRAGGEGLSVAEPKYETMAYAPGLLQHERAQEEGDEYVADPAAPKATEHFYAQRVFARRVHFQTNALDVCPGSVVSFDSPRTKSDQLVVETKIVGDTSGAWSVACSSVSVAQPFRPPKLTPKPRIWGPQSAVVVGPESKDKEQIHCDDFGRVRVQFNWDRFHEFGHDVEEDDGDLLGSCWVRVASPWAGAGYGFVAIPRVGHEVLVAFLDGDPDRPVIVRSLHNDDNPAPFSAKNEPTKSGLRSFSTPAAGDKNGFNELSFDDKKGEEKIFVQAQRDMSTVVKAGETHDVGGGRRSSIGSSDILHVKDEWKLVAGNQETGVWVSASGSVLAQVGGAGGSQVVLSGNAVSINAKKDIHLHAGTQMHLSAMGTIDFAADPSPGSVHLNDPSRRGQLAKGVTLPSYTKANTPSPGQTRPLGHNPIPRGEQREQDRSPPRPLRMDAALTDEASESKPPPRLDAAPAAAESAEPGTLSEAEAQHWFDDFKRDESIPFDYPKDCCYARAHVMGERLSAAGVNAAKVWNYSSGAMALTRDATEPMPDDARLLTARTNNAPGGSVAWLYHVAPTVPVRTAGGRVEDRVIDPSMTDRPIPVQEWVGKQGDPNAVLARTSPAVYLRDPRGNEFPGPPASEVAATFDEHRANRDLMWSEQPKS